MLWIVLSDLGLIPIWVAIVFIARGAIVDAIRYAAISRGETAFGMMRTPLARSLVAGRWMRGGYGAVKAVTFAWVLMLQPWPALYPAIWVAWSPMLHSVTTALVLTSVVFCLVRGLPVIAEFVVDQKVFNRPQISAGSR